MAGREDAKDAKIKFFSHGAAENITITKNKHLLTIILNIIYSPLHVYLV